MHPKIKEQEQLMRKALDILRKIEQAKSFFIDIDPDISRLVIRDYEIQYAETSAALLELLLPVGDLTLLL